MPIRVTLAMGRGRVWDDVKKHGMKKQESKSGCYLSSPIKESGVTMIALIILREFCF